jgi:RNA polymerase sigma factor (sigma-70 family)
MKEPTFDAIYAEFYGKIKNYLNRLVGADAAEDVTQAVFIKISQSMADFEGRSSMNTWIYKIAVNTAMDYLRGEVAAKKRFVAATDTLIPAASEPCLPGNRATPENKAEVQEQNA